MVLYQNSVFIGIQSIGLGRRTGSCYHAGSCSARQQGSLGPGVGQWITVYNDPPRQSANQRCHEHVHITRLGQLSKKGKEEGLFISSVAYCHGLWTFVMEADTGFTEQVSYETCSPML